MLRYAGALQGSRLLNEEFTRTVMTGKVTDDQEAQALHWHQRDGYAYGLVDSAIDGKPLVWHNGGASGRRSQFDMFPAHGWTIVILSNYDPMLLLPLVEKAEKLVAQS